MLKIKINDFYISVKISAVLIFLLMIALGYTEQFFILYIFVVIHELIHIFTGKLFGRGCRGITVMPTGLCAEIDGIDDIGFLKRNIVVLSAPFFNIAVGIILGKNYIGMGNIAIGAFNLLPIFPLDGARIFQSTVGYFAGTLEANRYTALINSGCILILIGAGIIWFVLFDYNFTVLAAAIYLYKEKERFAMSNAVCFYRMLVKKRKRNFTKIRVWRVDKDLSIKKVLYRLCIDYYTLIYTEGRIIDEDTVKTYISKYGIGGCVKNIIK